MILEWISSFEEMKSFILNDLCVVSSGDFVESVLSGFLEETIEFDEIVAEDIGIGCESLAVSFVDVLDDPFLVFFAEIKCMKGESEIFGNPSSFFHIDESRTVGGIGDIVDHESAFHLMPRLPEEVGDDGRIDSAREPDQDFHIFLFYF